jgi:DNA repair protein RecN (Recombination protein N)
VIKSLFINNFTLIYQLEINFGAGLNILTGETGAGKSILIDAIDLVFGARSSKEQIKTGTNKAVIELHLKLNNSFPKELLDENEIEVEKDNILVISREISYTGTRSRINGVLVTQNYIQNLREHVIDIHSQNETYNYIQPKTHITLLDNYGDKTHQELLELFKSTYFEYKHTKKELENIKVQIQSKEQKIDFLKFQIDEISEAKIEDTDEYDNLIQERLILLNAEELKELTYSSYNILYSRENSVIDILNHIENKLVKASEFDQNLSEITETISSNSISLKDLADQLRTYSDNLETDPEKLTLIEERLELLDKLKRKYGPDLTNILDNLQKFEEELNEIEVKSENIEQLTQKLRILEENIKEKSKQLSDSRKNLAQLLSNLIQKELLKLEMPKVQFLVKVDAKEEVSNNGIDSVEFLISPNLGEPLKSLSKIASGGEISRVMLAIKTIFAKCDQINTVIFDEIDSGISGKTSQAIAEELASLAQSHQVLCITHQPIIAAMADEHFYIEKIQNENSTKIQVNNLNSEEKISAVSKLASGSNQDQDSLNFAVSLIQQADAYKKSFKTTVVK